MHQNVKVWMIRLVVITFFIGAFVGWEVREVAQVRRPWQVVSRRPVLPWQTTPDAVDTLEAKSYPMVRVRRWSFYGLGPNRSSTVSRDDGKLHSTDATPRAER